MKKTAPVYAIQAGSELVSGKLYALVAPGGRAALLEIAAQMAAAPGVQRLRVLDAGNWFNAYAVASRLRQLLGRAQVSSIIPCLERIQVARAFTCFQVAALLEEAANQTTPQSGPCLVLDMLSAFHDENVKYSERLRLLRSSLPALRRLCGGGPVLVCIRPGDPALTGLVINSVDSFVQMPSEAEQNPHRQTSFWED